MRGALMVALKREALDGKGQKTKKLFRIADALVDAAIDGDVHAAKEIFDRVDGRVPQAIAGADGESPAEIVIRWLTADAESKS